MLSQISLEKTKKSPSRVIIDRISPDFDNGHFPAKRAQGEWMDVRAVIVCDGHDILKADLLYRHESEKEWNRTPMSHNGNDLWHGRFQSNQLGFYYYTVEASLDRFASWRDGLLKKVHAAEHSWVDFEAGYQLMEDQIAKMVFDHDKTFVRDKLNYIKHASQPLMSGAYDEAAYKEVHDTLLDGHLEYLMHWVWDDPGTVRHKSSLPVQVDTKLSNFSAWYEFFPRSKWKDMAMGAGLWDCEKRLEYIADLGFDIVYLPPVHPIGQTFRKGKNNSLEAWGGDPGSPWAIGNHQGGHKAINPDLGNFDDFARVVDKAHSLGMKVALDIAFQCSPDHPYVHEHPEWFKKRADGSIQYAENPPKKYQDIVPFDFECEDWKGLWEELRSIFYFWIEKGVRVFRVDNPHTKSLAFWEWALGAIRKEHPDIIFLAEAFTRPHLMAYLAKIGFNQSYTYFAWRDTKEELIQYMTELTQTEWLDFYRPNFWPNTPDILTDPLQHGGKAASVQRVILASMLCSNYGIYGPVYELLETEARPPNRVEYLNSEKYEIREWDVSQPHSIAPLIRLLNKIRHENPAMQTNHTIKFHPIENDQLIAFTKQSDDQKNTILVVVNLDYHHTQSAILDLQLEDLGLMPGQPYELADLLTGARYEWNGWRNFISLNPHALPAHVFRITQHPTDI